LNIDTRIALLLTAQLAAWGFWLISFSLKRWNVFLLCNLRCVADCCPSRSVLSHRSVFRIAVLMALLGFIYWSTATATRARARQFMD
jgi:hypothetical protein